MLLIPLVQLIELVCVNSSMKVNCIFVFWHGNEWSINIAVLRQLVNIMLVVVRVTGAIVAVTRVLQLGLLLLVLFLSLRLLK
jgi:hypothetical protein